MSSLRQSLSTKQTISYSSVLNIILEVVMVPSTFMSCTANGILTGFLQRSLLYFYHLDYLMAWKKSYLFCPQGRPVVQVQRTAIAFPGAIVILSRQIQPLLVPKRVNLNQVSNRLVHAKLNSVRMRINNFPLLIIINILIPHINDVSKANCSLINPQSNMISLNKFKNMWFNRCVYIG